MILKIELKEALDILRKARNNLSLEDYINIWGEHLGKHIWYQEGTDILRFWRSGLTIKQVDDFVEYILDKYQEKGDE